MASLRDLLNSIERTIHELDSTRAEAAVGITLNLIALVKLRVIETGEKADGGKFTKYSEAHVPYWFMGSGLKHADFNVKEKQKELLKKKGYFVTYPDWREINHREIDFKNFSFTNYMWSTIVPFVDSEGDNSVVIEIRSRDDFLNKTVIPAQNNREGINILQASKKELAMVRAAEIKRVEAILSKNGLL